MSDPIGDAARAPVDGPDTANLSPAHGAPDTGTRAAEPVQIAIVSESSRIPQIVVVCPLLEVVRRGDVVDSRTDPGIGPVQPEAGNRCAASSPPTPVSVRQQEFVCLDASHVDCPRFVRALGPPRAGGGRLGRPAAVAVETVAAGAAIAEVGSPSGTVTAETGIEVASGSGSTAAGLAGPAPIGGSGLGAPSAGTASTGGAKEPPPSAPVPVSPVTRSSRRSGARRMGPRPTPVVIAAGILFVALLLTVAFVSMRGGLALPTASPSATAVVSPSPIASVGASPSPTTPPSPSPAATPSPIPSPSAVISPTPAPTPSASLPAAYQGLKACPDRPDCYLYRVRSGDNMTSIAAHFGITVAALKAANPEITDPSLVHVGDRIRVPLP